jgi:hypothetical protein
MRQQTASIRDLPPAGFVYLRCVIDRAQRNTNATTTIYMESLDFCDYANSFSMACTVTSKLYILIYSCRTVRRPPTISDTACMTEGAFLRAINPHDKVPACIPRFQCTHTTCGVIVRHPSFPKVPSRKQSGSVDLSSDLSKSRAKRRVFCSTQETYQPEVGSDRRLHDCDDDTRVHSLVKKVMGSFQSFKAKRNQLALTWKFCALLFALPTIFDIARASTRRKSA